MITAIFAIATAVCAVGWFCSRVGMMALLRFMDEKGYTLPTAAEVSTYCRKAAAQMFKKWNPQLLMCLLSIIVSLLAIVISILK